MLIFGKRLYRRALFFDQLAVAIDAGLTPGHALETLAGGEGLGKVAARAAERARSGLGLTESLGQALDEVSGVDLPAPFEMAALRVGEEAGRLPATLHRLAGRATHRGAMLDRMARKMLYPIVLLHGAVLLPPLHLLVRDGLGGYRSAVLPGLVLVWIGLAALVLLWRRPPRAVDTVPVLGKALRLAATARYAHALNLLLAAGAPWTTSLDRAAAAAGQRRITAAGHRVARAVRGGSTIHAALAAERVFPPLLIEAARVGETAGKLEETLAKAEEALRKDAEAAAGTLVALVTAAVLAFAALVVLKTLFDFWGGYAGMLE